MSTWTPTARVEIERYFAQLGPTLSAGGADPAEVIEDLRRHLEREVAAERLTIVTEADVRRLLTRIGAPHPEAPSPSSPSSANGKPAEPAAAVGTAPKPQRPGVWLLLLGVVLPSIAWLIEMGTGMCAAAFFDPMPTLGHVGLVGLVPVVNLLCWNAGRSTPPTAPRWIAVANAAAIGIAAFSALQFLPLLLPGLLAIIIFGWGLLPWAPLLSLVAALGLRRHLRRVALERASTPLPRLWPAAFAAFVVLCAFDASVWATRVGLSRAASDDPAMRARGVALLRSFGHHDTLLRACYGRMRRAAQMDLVSLFLSRGREVSPEQAREIYYRVIGRPFNAVPPPEIRTGRGMPLEFDDWTWDAEHGSEEVGGRIRGLSLRSSRLDAAVEADAGLAYCEWVLEFRNDSSQAREARTQILLPRGGVVSRLTLWINGEEREAAFSSRSKTRQAYQSVAIQQRRDPVLVTTAGPDRVLMQCFPVPADGGTMKVRLGVTAPLVLLSARDTVFQWPQFLERNFGIPDHVRHTLWLDTGDARGLTAETLRADAGGNGGRRTVHGDLSDVDLTAGVGRVLIQRNPEVQEVWAADPRSTSPRLVHGRCVETNEAPVSQLVVVVDGSVTLRDSLGAMTRAIGSLPESTELGLIVASDDASRLEEVGGRAGRRGPGELARRLGRVRFGGGHDNLPGLEQAWDLAAARPGSVVVWVHGPQPVLLGATDRLRQRCERAAGGPTIFSFQLRPGPNRLLERLDDLPCVQTVPRLGSVEADLSAFLGRLAKPSRVLRVERVSRPEASLPDAPGTRQVSFHLVRLWAYDTIRALNAAHREDASAAAVKMAGLYQLVTPVSGAVVLETEEQYQRFRLQAAARETTPSMPTPGLDLASPPPMLEVATIPEPGVVSLAVLGLALFGAYGWHRRAGREPSSRVAPS